MPSVRLTDAAVKRLAKPERGQTDYFDQVLPGFGLRVSASGRRSWFVLYRVKGGTNRGKQRRFTLPLRADALGLADARQIARDALIAIERGEDPSVDKRRHRTEVSAAITVQEACDVFIERYAKRRNRSWTETSRILKKDVCSDWGDRALESISRSEALALIDSVADRAPVMANRTLAAIRKMFNWHIERGTIGTSPVERLSAPTREQQRERTLSDAEIRLFWQACSEYSYPFGPLFKCLLLTAQRRIEVSNAEWSEIDLEKQLWKIPAARTKPGREHEVPLSNMTVELLLSLPRFGPLVFSTASTGDRPVSGFSNAKKRLEKRMEELAEAPIPNWHLHDLRRTASTGMAAAGIPRYIISKVLNHAEGGVTQIYDRFSYSNEKAEALEAWASDLIAKLDGSF